MLSTLVTGKLRMVSGPRITGASLVEAMGTISVAVVPYPKAVPSFGSGLSEPSPHLFFLIEAKTNWIDESGSLFPVGLAKSKFLYFSRVRPEVLLLSLSSL